MGQLQEKKKKKTKRRFGGEALNNMRGSWGWIDMLVSTLGHMGMGTAELIFLVSPHAPRGGREQADGMRSQRVDQRKKKIEKKSRKRAKEGREKKEKRRLSTFPGQWDRRVYIQIIRVAVGFNEKAPPPFFGVRLFSLPSIISHTSPLAVKPPSPFPSEQEPPGGALVLNYKLGRGPVAKFRVTHRSMPVDEKAEADVDSWWAGQLGRGAQMHPGLVHDRHFFLCGFPALIYWILLP